MRFCVLIGLTHNTSNEFFATHNSANLGQRQIRCVNNWRNRSPLWMSFLTTWTNQRADVYKRFSHVINARSFVPPLFDCTQSRLCPLDRMRTRLNAVPHCRQTRSGFLAKRCFLRVSSSQRPPFGCSDQNYAHVSTGHREGGRPDSIVSRETRTHVAEAPRAHRTRRPQGERAPRIVTRPRLSRGKKPGKEDGPGTLFTRRGRARETSRRVFFARIAVEWHRDGVFSRSCGARLVRASPRSSQRARTQSPVARFPHREGNFSVNVHGGFFPRDSGRRRAGCSTRARDHLNPGFSRMNPPGVLRATTRFSAYYTRHHRTRRGDTIATP